MNLRANTETKFLLKYLIIGLGCLAFACWSLYDGLYKFPNEIPRAEAWQKLKSDVESDPTLTRTDLNERWKVVADENGWSSKQLGADETVESIETKVVYQYIFMAIGVGIGLPCLIWYLRSRNTWIESTADGLRSSNGAELKITQIKKFDKKKWERKGIGVLHYETDEGSTKKFVIDDLKYERKTTDEIVRWIESQIPLEFIVNGLPESALDMPEAESSESQDLESV